jgi:hypothetical protein
METLPLMVFMLFLVFKWKKKLSKTSVKTEIIGLSF